MKSTNFKCAVYKVREIATSCMSTKNTLIESSNLEIKSYTQVSSIIYHTIL